MSDTGTGVSDVFTPGMNQTVTFIIPKFSFPNSEGNVFLVDVCVTMKAFFISEGFVESYESFFDQIRLVSVILRRTYCDLEK